MPEEEIMERKRKGNNAFESQTRTKIACVEANYAKREQNTEFEC